MIKRIQGLNRKRTQIHIESNPDGSEIRYLTFTNLSGLPDIRHLFSTRYGGVSSGFLGTMNLGTDRGDSYENVLENHRRLLRILGSDCGAAVHSKQEHGANVRIVTKEDCGKGLLKERDYRNVDALVTNLPEIPLVIYGADCVPVFFADPKKGVIGAAHAGWKGTARKIVKNTLQTMQDAFGTNVSDVFCAIGPSICPECYEIGEEVAEHFRESFGEELPGREKILLPGKRERHAYLNLQEANRQILLQEGIPGTQIEISDLCTCCNPDLLFSHRATNGRRGNNAGYIMLYGSK